MRPSGTFLQAPLDGVVMKRLDYLERYPELCQLAIDGYSQAVRVECAGSLAVCEASCRAREVRKVVKADPGWSTLSVVGFTLGGVMAGLLVGGAVGLGAVNL